MNYRIDNLTTTTKYLYEKFSEIFVNFFDYIVCNKIVTNGKDNGKTFSTSRLYY